MDLYAGTSGFSYPEWRGGFYPEGLAAGDMLAHYGTRLPAVEINNTFYRMPRRDVLASWREAVPDGFRFVIKASRRITHHKRLREPQDALGFLYRGLETLGDTLGAVLYQTPPYFRKDPERLERFLDLLPEGARAAFDFHNEAWNDEETARLLESRGHALCVTDRDEGDGDPLDRVAGDWGYLRLRRAAYDDGELAEWRRRVEAKGWSEAYVFFKHEEDCAGPDLAQRFLG